MVMFVDLKAVFNTMDRAILIETMRRRDIREELIERIEEVLSETRCRMRMQGEVGERF